MAKLEKRYTNLTDVINLLLIQVNDSVSQVPYYVPPVRTPEQLFYYLKSVLTYKKDPPGVEYLQTLQTLFDKNKGYGDCDCFTITALASLKYYGLYERLYIVLVGYDKESARHIYAGVQWEGDFYVFDLTNPFFDMERTKYRYRQIIDVTKLIK